MAEFTMPSLGADMESGTVLQWLVAPGDTVHRGDVVALVDTDKAAVDVECFDEGVVQRLLVAPGEKVPVGAVLAIIGPADVPAAAGGPPLREAAVAVEPAPTPPAGTPPPRGRARSPLVRHLAAERGVDLSTVSGTGAGGTVTRRDVERASRQPQRRRISPLARRLGAELGVDLDSVPGTGDAGSVRAADVRRAAATAVADGVAAAGNPGADPAAAPAAAPPAAPAHEFVPEHHQLSMRRAIAALMSRSNQEIPHYHLTSTIDLVAAVTWLRDRNRRAAVSERLVPAALLLKAVARAAHEVPELNGYWADDRFVAAPEVRIGTIVSLPGGGIVAPVIPDVTDLDLPGLMRRLRDLVDRARRGRLRGSELTGATITVSNLGDQGADTVLGVIHPPQVALVGFGAVVQRPWAVDGLLGVHPVVTVSLAGDHRASDGATGSRFLRAIDHALQRPEQL